MAREERFVRLRRRLNIVFFSFWIFAILGILRTLNLHGGIQNFDNALDFFLGEFKIGELIVGLGTVILALFTADLAITSSQDAENNRLVMIRESQRDRRKLRIKEQLEGLYSPLMASIRYFPDPREHFDVDTAIWKKMNIELRDKYEFLARDDLRDMLREYYRMRDTQPLNFQEIGATHFEENLVLWRTRLNRTQEIIRDDFEHLTNEYNNLTRELENN